MATRARASSSFLETHLGRERQAMGGFRLKTRSALLKRLPREGGSACGVKAAVASVAKVKDASAAHSSHELQLQEDAVSTG
jgi:hypothetical protein